jgi:hypothetical protein
MSARYDSKGKYFTQIVPKTPLKILIQTATNQIRGTAHIHPDHRLLDELNDRSGFLPITNATIIESESEREVKFIAIQKTQIVWATPLEEHIREKHDQHQTPQSTSLT